jgi:NAD+ synthetase
MRIACAQANFTVGDLEGNAKKIKEFIRRAESAGAETVIFPELSITGYPPQDLLDKNYFIRDNISTLNKLTGEVPENITVIVGYVDFAGNGEDRKLYNSAAVLRNGKILSRHYKSLLPNYDVFDEKRYFKKAESINLAEIGNLRCGVTICEDIWNDSEFWKNKRYDNDPAKSVAELGADLLINISGSPFCVGKPEIRREMAVSLAKKHGFPVVLCNLIGGNDQLVFDGNSLIINKDGTVLAQGKPFEEDLIVADINSSSPETESKTFDTRELLNSALILGSRDYTHKCGFSKAVIGLSGGIDSAVTAYIAVEALGAENVTGVAMPSMYSSSDSEKDARKLAENLGIDFKVFPIKPIYDSYIATFAEEFKGLEENITEENIQARIRGNILMALSNKYGTLVFATGNKSEMAVGYCTLYGDMSGGLAVISDVPKTMVYELAKWINRDREIIPDNTITRPPSAELRPDQTDQDSLPDYDTLDKILGLYIEDLKSRDEIVAATGYDKDTVYKVVRMVDLNEYKRKQAAPGLKVTSKAFGLGRRLPIAQRYY